MIEFQEVRKFVYHTHDFFMYLLIIRDFENVRGVLTKRPYEQGLSIFIYDANHGWIDEYGPRKPLLMTIDEAKSVIALDLI